MPSPVIAPVLSLVSRVGFDPADDAETRNRKNILTVASVLGSLSLVLWSLPMFAFGVPLAGGLWLLYALVMLSSLALWMLTRRGYRAVVFVHLTCLLLFPFLLGLVAGSYTGIGCAWYALLAVLAAIFYFPRQFLWWCAAAAVTVVVGAAVDGLTGNSPKFTEFFMSVLYAGSFLTLSGVAVSMLNSVLRQRDEAYRLLASEREKSENLLLNILPQEIASLLKVGPRFIANHYPAASVLFADVVNFTPLTAGMPAQELVGLLDDVFSFFDGLAEKYQLEKIKTIGDCYMVAAGVPVPRSDHARALTAMAIEMQAYVSSHTFHDHNLAFRIGINSGPLVAGVIGRKKFIYDLWGDTVNTASRMESHGASGVIQVTRSTYELIKDEYPCEPQGLLNVKGKGEMEVWHVIWQETTDAQGVEGEGLN